MATVTIAATSIPNFHYVGTLFTWRIFSDRSWVAADGTVVPARGDTNQCYKEYTLSVGSNIASAPQVVLLSQTDAPNEKNARYSIFLYIDGVESDMFLANTLGAFQVPDTPASTTWSALEQYNFRTNRRYYQDENTYNRLQIDQKIAAVTGTTNLATSTVAGLPTASTAGRQRLVTDVDESLYLDNGTQWWSLTHGVFDFKRFGGVGDGATSNTTILSSIITAIGSNQGRVIFPYSASPYVLGSISIPANVVLDFSAGGSIYITTGQTVTILSDGKDWPVRKIFYNATSGQGAVSFSGTKVAPWFLPQWWGAVGNGVTDDDPAIQAAMAAAGTAGGGTVYCAKANYLYSSLNLGNNELKSISLIGEAGPGTGTTFTWSGSGTGFNTAWSSFSTIENILFKGNGAGIGVLFSGPQAGTNSHGMIVRECIFQDFDYGVSVGEASHAASEITFQSCVFDSNDIVGAYIANFNTISISFNQSSFTANGSYGLQDGGSGGPIRVDGGGASENGIADFYFASANITASVKNVRSEMAGANGLFILGGLPLSLSVESCTVRTNQALAGAVIVANGQVAIKNFTAVVDGNPFYIFGDNEGAGQRPTGSLTQVTIEDSAYDSALPIPILVAGINGSIAGLTYTLRNNFTWALGSPVAKAVNEVGVVAPWPARTAISQIGAANAFTPTSPSQITANQDNYSLGAAATAVAQNVRLNSDASRNITGFTTTPTQVDGQTHYLWNVGAQNIVLRHQDASSTAANRILSTTGADLTLAANKCAMIMYDSTTARWRATLLP